MSITGASPQHAGNRRGHELTFTEDQLLAELCRKSYYRFVQEMWETIVPEKPIWNWHLKEMCDRIQIVVERIFRSEDKLYDLVTNVPPGMSKSLVHSVFLPAWCWTRMPSFKFIGASYSYPLAQELSVKTRDVVLSDKYQKMFPTVSLREDQNTKGHFKTLQNGGRYAVGVNGAVTGFHAHLICLPWEANVVTSGGEFPIGLVVDNQMLVDIMSFDHSSGCTRWSKIERYEVQPGRPLCRVTFTDGGVLELTHDHQVYVVGRGYVDPVDLNPGDLLYDCYEVEARHGGLRPVPNSFRVSRKALPQSPNEKQNGETVLLMEVPAGKKEDEAANLPVWEGTDAPAGEVLFGQLSGESEIRTESPEGGRASDGQVRVLREGHLGDSAGVGAGTEQGTVLRQEMRQRITLGTDDRGRKLELRPWQQPLTVLARLRSDQNQDSEKGRVQVLSVQPDDGAGGQEDVRPSCGLRQGEQLETQPDGGVSGVSRESSPEKLPTPGGLRHRVVQAVERDVRIPDKVYNLRVAQDHNYFAEGTLVHNCVDDPINPNEASSPADLATANRWLRETLPSRKVNKSIVPMILVMQRLHQDDPTAQMVKRGGVYRLCLPATDEDPIRPAKLKEKYVNGLLDPVRLPRKVLEETEKEMGEQAYAAQYRERPVPAGGAMFKIKDKWTDKKTHVLPVGPHVKFSKMIRFWDKAGTQGGRGPFTCGVLLAETTEGTWWVRNVSRFRLDVWGRESAILEQARLDRSRFGDMVMVGLEQEPGSGGKESLQATVARLRGFRVWWWKVDGTTGGKELRAEPWATQVNAGNVYLEKDDAWNDPFAQEHLFFPNSRFKDQVDAASGAFQGIAGGVIEVGGLQ